jgi:hypothetical protein
MSIISFVFFQARYSNTNNPAYESVNCGSLASCFFTNVQYGFASQGQLFEWIGAYTTANTDPNRIGIFFY